MKWLARTVTPHRLEGCTVITQSGRAYRVLAVTQKLDLVVEPAKAPSWLKRLQMRVAFTLKGAPRVP